MTAPSPLHAQRLVRWRQTPAARLAGPADATAFIDQLGIVTLFPVSPELPNLFQAYLGDPDAPTDSGHDTPSGEVYSWRWVLGRQEAGFYTAIVRNRPTWIGWPLLPAILRLRGDLRSPAAIHAAGELSVAALRVATTLAAAGGVLATGALRRAAGFPTGKEQRAAYHKALAELDSRLLLAKVFAPADLDMRHALVSTRFPEHVSAAVALTREAALDEFLRAYLPAAVYAMPPVLARHLGLPETELRAGLERLAHAGLAAPIALEGHKGACYTWMAESAAT
jgi:hypothetical protein